MAEQLIGETADKKFDREWDEIHTPAKQIRELLLEINSDDFVEKLTELTETESYGIHRSSFDPSELNDLAEEGTFKYFYDKDGNLITVKKAIVNLTPENLRTISDTYPTYELSAYDNQRLAELQNSSMTCWEIGYININTGYTTIVEITPLPTYTGPGSSTDPYTTETTYKYNAKKNSLENKTTVTIQGESPPDVSGFHSQEIKVATLAHTKTNLNALFEAFQ